MVLQLSNEFGDHWMEVGGGFLRRPWDQQVVASSPHVHVRHQLSDVSLTAPM